ncbi:TPA: GNAT family N-acetyltransferase [Candidatus Bathyarchaeota archaeon]|nr:GNAT family N-acetyltransferase [Candidatus Bathyarchaeota archaeon]
MPLKIRQATPTDQRAVKRIIDSSFPKFFRFFALRSVNSEEGKVLVVQDQTAVAGFAKLICLQVASRKCGCVLWLAVHPNCRRKGVASSLVKAGVEDLQRNGAILVFASVTRRNNASLGTFGKEGFRRIGFGGLWQLFGWRIFRFYSGIWYAPSEIVLMYSAAETENAPI